MPRISTVPDRCGSSSMSTVTTPRINANGTTPVENDFILSWFSEMICENTSTIENFAISLGCSVPSPGSTIHRLQPLYSGMNSTAVSSTSERTSSGQASL